jgi:hypothetical protein
MPLLTTIRPRLTPQPTLLWHLETLQQICSLPSLRQRISACRHVHSGGCRDFHHRTGRRQHPGLDSSSLHGLGIRGRRHLQRPHRIALCSHSPEPGAARDRPDNYGIAEYDVIVLTNGGLTTPQPIQLSAATPGLAASPDSTLIAQHSVGSLVSPTAPAVAGEYLVAYLAGLGDTTVPVASGAPSPPSPLAMPSNTVVLTINGALSPIYFAGLTPGMVGLYQINFQVPAGLPAGSITIVVSQNGQASNQTVLLYQP